MPDAGLLLEIGSPADILRCMVPSWARIMERKETLFSLSSSSKYVMLLPQFVDLHSRKSA